MNKRRSLGRGLDALLSSARPAAPPPPAVEPAAPAPVPASIPAPAAQKLETGLREVPVDVLRRARDRLDATMVALGGRHSSRLLGIVMGNTATELLHDARCSTLIARAAGDDRAWEPATVIVGVDGSAGSLAALEAADGIAARLGGTVEIVTAGGLAANGADWDDRVLSWDDAHPVAALLERSQRADLIVVGSRGLHGLKALGSVSERIAHQARCSVLVVHTSA